MNRLLSVHNCPNIPSKTATHAPPAPPPRVRNNTACRTRSLRLRRHGAGHLTRIGTKADVGQVYIDFFQHILEGAKNGIAEAPAGTGVFTPGNVDTGNLWYDGPLNLFGTGCALLP